MARLIPSLESWQELALAPRSEARFYEACRKTLGPDYLVIHSLEFIGRTPIGKRDGEVDFLIFSRKQGMVAVEVKGGGIRYDPVRDEWASVDRNGASHSIKDPFAQARNGKHQIGEFLRLSKRWSESMPGRFNWGHAVFFPDIGASAPFLGPSRPPEIIGVSTDLERLDAWLRGVFSYWESQSPDHRPLGDRGLQLAEEILCPRIEARCLLAPLLKEEEARRIVLTGQQARLLRSLRDTLPRVAIRGGAGTGKTLLALARAKELADSGVRTLLVCYNRPLADHLIASAGGHPMLFAMSYHQLCEWRTRLVREKCGRDLVREMKAHYPSGDLWSVHYPESLAESVDILDDRFGAIVVDEGQDFLSEWWNSMFLLLGEPDKDPVTVFYDPNQRLYRHGSVPFQESLFSLTINCRNTRAIHEAAYRFYEGVQTDPPDIEGTPVDFERCEDEKAQARAVIRRVAALFEEGINPQDITVLVGHRDKERYYQLLRSHPLPKGVRWAFEAHAQLNVVRVDSVRRFKGLESLVVILWGTGEGDVEESSEGLYVGLSRARSLLIVVGAPALAGVLPKVDVTS